MPSISLTFYSIKVFINKASKKQYFQLDNIEGESISQILFDYVSLDKNKYSKDANKELVSKIVYFECQNNTLDGRDLYDAINCIMESGNYGLSGKIINTEDENYTVTYLQKPAEAALKPFGFNISYKKGNELALLCIESIGKNSIIGDVQDFIKKAFNYYSNSINISKKIGKLNVEISNVYPLGYIKKMIDEALIKEIAISVNKTHLHDLSEKYPIDSKKKIIILREPSFINKAFLHSIISGKESFEALAEIKNDSEEIEDIKYVLDFNGKERTVSFSSYNSFRIAENIEDLVVKSTNGYPKRQSLFRIMNLKSMDYIRWLGLIGSELKGHLEEHTDKDMFLDLMEKDKFYD